MIRPLHRLQYIRVILWLELEVRAAVLQREAATFGDDCGTETGVVRDDETASIALWVGDAEVYGIGGESHWCAMVDCVNRCIFGELGPTIREVGW